MNNQTKKYGIGIIGGGNWAKRYVPAIRNSEILDLKGVAVGYDVSEFAREFDLRLYEEADQLFEDESIDIVCIVLQHQLHCEYAIRAMEHGKHVMVEKPMAVSVAECDRQPESRR